MTAKTASPTTLPAWQQLTAHAARVPALAALFAQQPQRGAAMRALAAGITVDWSRQQLDAPAFDALIGLAEQTGVPAARDAMFAGYAINATERRPALHVALRAPAAANPPWGEAIRTAVAAELDRFLAFAEALRAGAVTGFAGAPITDVVNLGIGGSDLGPKMATEALAAQQGPVAVHYVSSPDAWALWGVLRTLNPATTLFVVSSKSFTTQETIRNFESATRWLRDGGCPEAALANQLAAVTASPDRAAAAGFAAAQTFVYWDWVGGRYSLWSAIGLPLAVAIGAAAFRQLLDGAAAMDEHFARAPLDRNLPVILALTGVWNRNFLGLPTQLLVPYAARLARFTPFIQQMDMESNGKSTHVGGDTVAIDTGPIVWGGHGLDAQHSFFQLLHQGTHRVPVEFIGVATDDTPLPGAADHHRIVLANLVAQASALAFGRDLDQTRTALAAAGMPADEIARLAPHCRYPGNVPSTLLWLDALTPATVGALIALYEHKVFVQAAVWGIHPYDQWGVELGKAIARGVLPALDGTAGAAGGVDPAAAATIAQLRDR